MKRENTGTPEKSSTDSEKENIGKGKSASTSQKGLFPFASEQSVNWGGGDAL